MMRRDLPELPSEQVAADLRQRIRAGEWQPRERMPSVSELARHYSTGHGTVRKGLHLLAGEGLVIIVPRWGTFRA